MERDLIFFFSYIIGAGGAVILSLILQDGWEDFKVRRACKKERKRYLEKLKEALPVFTIIGEEEPLNPLPGQLWYHPAKNKLLAYDGKGWIEIEMKIPPNSPNEPPRIEAYGFPRNRKWIYYEQ
jgi:hypothetical protein